MTSIDRSPTGPDSRRSSGRSTPTSQVQRQMTPTNFNSIEIKNPLLGAAVSIYKILDVIFGLRNDKTESIVVYIQMN